MNTSDSSKYLNICDIYVVLYVMRQYANMYINSSIVAIATSILMMLISFFCFYLIIKHKMMSYIKGLVVFIIFVSIYGLLHWASGETVGDTKPNAFFLGNWSSLTPILIFYIGTLKGWVNEKRMRIYFVLFMIIAVLSFNYGYLRGGVEVEEDPSNISFTNSASYLFVFLLPNLFLFNKKPIIQYSCLLIMVYFIMIGLKRGAIITGLSFLPIFVIGTYQDRRNKSIWRVVTSVMLIIITSYVIYYFVQRFWINNDFFNYRLNATMENDSSGRDEIFKALLDNFINNGNIFHMVFGLGAEGTMRIVQIHAHNDWLELLTDCGILGVLVYLVYFYYFYICCRKYKGINPESRIVLSCFVILLVKTVFSMSFMSMFLGITSVLGYGMAICEQKYLGIKA